MSGPEDEPSIPPVERGATRIADRAVASVAAQAAREALRAGPGAGPGSVSPPRNGRAARAGVDVHAGIAQVRISVELGYPSDIGAQCGAVRRQVAARVGELTGMEVSDVAVRVDRLHSAHLRGEAVGRVR